MATSSAATWDRLRRTEPAREDRRALWREALWGLDWLSLRFSPVYFGLGVPRGDHSPVVLVPGFLTSDAYLIEMYFWLQRIGYTPYLSGIGVNADCVQALAERLERTVDEIYSDTGTPVRVVGHSLGGFLARKLALNRPDIVSHIIALGSPIQSLQAHPVLMTAAKWVGRHASRRWPNEGAHPRDDCECQTDHCIPAPPPSVRRAAIYSRDDGIIDWRNCVEPDPELNHEVGGTHVGLVFNPRVYRIVASLLATARRAGGPRRAKRRRSRTASRR